MKGYLIKDYRLLLSQRNMMIIIPIGLIFLFTNETPFTGISYILYLITFLGNSLISYDTFENGMTFLMTLPGGRKDYVNEKYIFNLTNSTVAAILLIGIGSALELARGKGIMAVKEILLGTLLLYALATVFSSVMLTINLKFGPEKSRVVLMILFGVVFLGTMSIGYLLEKLHVNIDRVIENLNQLSVFGVCACVLAGTILFTFGSWAVSQEIMKTKNF